MSTHSLSAPEDDPFSSLPNLVQSTSLEGLERDPEDIFIFDPIAVESAHIFHPDDWPVEPVLPPESMLPQKVYTLCTSGQSISSEIATNPEKSIGDVGDKLYGSHNLKFIDSPGPKKRNPASKEELERARQCGRFGDTDPSELFLRAFYDVLFTIELDPLNGLASPSMLGSTGVVPFTVIGTIHDVLRHMSNLIVQAEKEVLLATNFWIASGGSRFITDSLNELSMRAGARGEKIPVKIMYDRGSARQVFDNHQTVPPAVFTGKYVELPSPEEVPHLDMHVVNFHRPILGTFHPKFLVVDRRVAVTQSNNVQDNDNMEMMVQLEGPIVDSLWETFLISWHKAISPLNCLDERAADKPLSTFKQDSFRELFDYKGQFKIPQRTNLDSIVPQHLPSSPHYDADIAGEIARTRSMLSPQAPSDTQAEIVARHLNAPTCLTLAPTAPSPSPEQSCYFPYLPHSPHNPIPIALVSRKPFGSPMHTSLHTPQNTAFLSLISNAKHDIFIQTPDLNASPLFDTLLGAVRRGVRVTYYVCMGYNDAGEQLPGQGGKNEDFASRLYAALVRDPGAGAGRWEVAREGLRVGYYVAKDQTRPIHNDEKKRSCHVKLLIADGAVGVQGSGNMDGQSWWQSEEVNVMVDSAGICGEWRRLLEGNQGTGKFGMVKVPEDGGEAEGRMGMGVWRDEEGRVVEGEAGAGASTGAMDWVRGWKGAVRKARGMGGF